MSRMMARFQRHLFVSLILTLIYPLACRFPWTAGSDELTRNYAANECGSKVIAANPEAEGTYKILLESRDEYMLNPCKAKIWFVVELCEPILVTSIELANFELYSSTPKEITFHGSDKYPTNDWIKLGVFEAADSRDLQRFDISSPAVAAPATQSSSQYIKFIRVDLSSFYGSEHFCPISLIRAFGQSLAEEFDVIESQQNNQQPQAITGEVNQVLQTEKPRGPQLDGIIPVPSSTDTEAAKEATEGSCFKEGEPCPVGSNSSILVETISLEAKDTQTNLSAESGQDGVKVEVSNQANSDVKSDGQIASSIPTPDDVHSQSVEPTPSLFHEATSSVSTATSVSDSISLTQTDTSQTASIEPSTTMSSEVSSLFTESATRSVVLESKESETSSKVDGTTETTSSSSSLMIEPSLPLSQEEVKPQAFISSNAFSESSLVTTSSVTSSEPPSTSSQISILTPEPVPVNGNGVNEITPPVIVQQPLPPSSSSPSAAVIAASSSKESIFIKLNNKIKILEQNMTNGFVLLEDVKKRQEILEIRMNLFLNQTLEREQKDIQKMSELQEKLNDITEKVYLLVTEKEVFHWQLIQVHILLMVLEISAIVIIMSSFLKRMTRAKKDEDDRSKGASKPDFFVTPSKSQHHLLYKRSFSSQGKRISPDKMVDHHPISSVALFGKKRKKKKRKNQALVFGPVVEECKENQAPVSSTLQDAVRSSYLPPNGLVHHHT